MFSLGKCGGFQVAHPTHLLRSGGSFPTDSLLHHLLNVEIPLGSLVCPPFASVYILIYLHDFKDHPCMMSPEYASPVSALP